MYFVFDLLHLDGEDLRLLPLIERKRRLAKLLSKAIPPILLSEHLDADGPEMFSRVSDMKLEGIISKRPLEAAEADQLLRVRGRSSR